MHTAILYKMNKINVGDLIEAFHNAGSSLCFISIPQETIEKMISSRAIGTPGYPPLAPAAVPTNEIDQDAETDVSDDDSKDDTYVNSPTIDDISEIESTRNRKSKILRNRVISIWNVPKKKKHMSKGKKTSYKLWSEEELEKLGKYTDDFNNLPSRTYAKQLELIFPGRSFTSIIACARRQHIAKNKRNNENSEEI